MTFLEYRILVTIEAQHQAAQDDPEPAKWQKWDHREWEIDREFNRRYSPRWFGPAAASEAGRVRHLRAIRRLGDEGSLEILRGDAGKLERVRLTDKGYEAMEAVEERSLA